jgi:sec-independent protein translocase protein TatA
MLRDRAFIATPFGYCDNFCNLSYNNCEYLTHILSEQFVRKVIMNFFGIGLPETIVILVVVLLVFGPKKLPEIGRSLGKAIKGFQEASSEFQSEFKKEVDAIESVVKTPAQIEPGEAAKKDAQPEKTEA